MGTNSDVTQYMWVRQSTQETESPAAIPSIYSVSALDANHVWAVGNKGTILFYDGSSWSPQKGASWGLESVSAADANHVWAVGGGGSIVLFNGSAWSSQKSGTTNLLYSVSATDASHIWVGEDDGTILFGSPTD